MRGWLLALIALASAGSLAPAPSAPEPRPSHEAPLVRTFDRRHGGDVLLELNPVTLQPTSPPLRTFPDLSGFAFSPDGSRLALGGGFFARGRLQLVDLQRWSSHVLDLGRRSPVHVIRWLARDRLLVDLGGADDRHVIGVVDPVRRVIVRRAAYRGWTTGWVAGEYGVVTVVSPSRGLRRARLVHVEPQAVVRSTPLDRIEAGIAERSRGHGRLRLLPTPALAVQPGRPIAYVVSAESPLVAEVDLASGRVAYHRLAKHRSLTDAEPVRAAKDEAFEERTRDARWLGGGRLAVAGEDRRAFGGRPFRYRPFGAWLIDTRAWTISLLDRRPTLIASATDRLLATGRHGPSWDHRGRRDAGLLAFDARGRRLFRRFHGEDVTVLGVHRGYAYVWVRRTRMLHTLELASGRSLYRQRVGPGRLPPLLAPEGFGGLGG